MRTGKRVDDLSLAELEQLLVTRRREERLRRLHERGIERELPEAVTPLPEADSVRLPPPAPRPRFQPRGEKAAPSLRSRLLTVIEVVALLGFVVAGYLWWRDTQATNLERPEAVAAAATPEGASAAPPNVLPGNPPAPVGASPIPAIYREWVQPSSDAVALPASETQDDLRPVRIVIPALDLDAIIVPGDDWEALKRGVGHLGYSANPGERGNMVLSAHNDIFGELFRYLERLEPGDEFTVYDALDRKYHYVVSSKRIVEPTEVSVVAPTSEPVATLITCHPYLVDTKRLVVQAVLVR